METAKKVGCFQMWRLYLSDVLEPPAQSDEDEEHGRSIKEGDGALRGPLSHGHHQDHTGVDVCHRGS